MSIVKKMITISLLFISITSNANIPLEVLQSCIKLKPYNNNIQLSELDNDGYDNKKFDNCEDLYDRIINDHIYGTADCYNKFYFIIKDKKLDPAKARNYSINPEIKPGNYFSSRASWYQINLAKESYICIAAPLTESGIGDSAMQYYIIENAFDEKKDPVIYYYFFEKDIIPIDS